MDDVTELERRCARAICIAIGDDPDREGDERITSYDNAARAVLAEAGVAELVEALQGLLDNTLSNQAPRGLDAVMKARAAIAKARA